MDQRSRFWWHALWTVSFLVAEWLPATRASDGVEAVGVSAQSEGRGGADVAVGDSAMSHIDNPALLLMHECTTYDLAGKLVIPRFEWVGPAGKAYSNVIVPALNVGASIPVNEDFSWGWAMYTKSGDATRYNNHHLQIPQIELTDRSDYENVAFPINFAYRVSDRLWLGAGGRFEIASTRFSDVFGPAYFTFQRGYAVGGGFQAGLLYKACDTVNIGVGYRSPTWCGSLDGGDGTIQVFPLVPNSTSLGEAHIDNFRLPQRISGGVAWDATERVKLSGEIRYINYSNSTLGSTVIHTGGTLAPLVPADLPFPLKYKDQLVLIGGADFKVNEHWTWRVGYNYGTAPVENSGLLPTASVIPQHNVTTGLQFNKDNWWVTGGYILSATTVMNTSGGNGFLGAPNDYAASRLSQTMHSLFVGIGFKR
jgi:long-subunit fatty acid transport protein